MSSYSQRSDGLSVQTGKVNGTIDATRLQFRGLYIGPLVALSQENHTKFTIQIDKSYTEQVCIDIL